jgi:hypothetical protein
VADAAAIEAGPDMGGGVADVVVIGAGPDRGVLHG